MAITPEQVKNQEFPIRLKGYDPDAVRAFLVEVAAAYRATIRDEGAQWALHNISDDLAAVLRAAHGAAEKVLAAAEAEAAELRAKAAIEAEVIRRDAERYAEQTRSDADAEAARAIQVLKRTQGKAADIHRDADEAQSLLADARARAEKIIAEAESRATYVHDEADAALAAHRAEALADREEARELLERIETRARDLLTEAEEVRVVAEAQARDRVAEVLRDGQQRLDALEDAERAMQDRLHAAQREFQEIVRRLLVSDETTIDLTDDEPLVVLDGRYDEGRPSSHAAPAAGAAEAAPDDLVRQMVSVAVGQAAETSRG